MNKKYQVLFYKGEPVDITLEERNEIMKQMNNPNKKFVFLSRLDRMIMFGNIAGIDTCGKSYDGGLLDMPYNPDQIEEPKTFVQAETKRKMDEYAKKYETSIKVI